MEPGSTRSSSIPLTAWIALALTNLTAGLVISSWPDRQLDVRRVAHWARLWLDGVNLYAEPTEYVDYPPHAIVLLSPLGFVTDQVLVPLWAQSICSWLARPSTCRFASSGRRARFALSRSVWSLLTFYHLTYGFLLLLPTAAILLLSGDPQTRDIRRRVFWAMQLGLMFDAVTDWRWAGPALGSPPAIGVLVGHADRLLMPAFAGALAVVAARRTL